MLKLPETGFIRSINSHNIDFNLLCDWIEGSILFCDDHEISITDVIDVLIEEQIYDDQDFAHQIVADAWAELHQRHSYSSPSPCLEFKKYRITRYCDWQLVPAYSFCMMLSLSAAYPKWFNSFGSDYTEQGELFEEITKASLGRQLPTWQIVGTGWSRNNTNKLNEVVRMVTDHLGEQMGTVEDWANPSANEAGLDLLCYRPFVDKRVGFPVYLIQCASGRNWQDKTQSPNMRIWTKIVQFASEPRRGLAIPFALQASDFRRSCNIVGGLLLDRQRILSASADNQDEWVGQLIRDRIINWLQPRVNTLPSLSI